MTDASAPAPVFKSRAKKAAVSSAVSPVAAPAPMPAPAPASGEPPSVAETIKRLRRQKSLSLEELAQMSGVSRSMLSQIERDATNPTVATLWRITSALGISIDEVLGTTGCTLRAVQPQAWGAVKTDHGEP